MGICIHCMQEKPITADKCHHCHERTGLTASLFWTVFHFVGKITVLILIVSLLYQCTGAGANTVATNVEQVNK